MLCVFQEDSLVKSRMAMFSSSSSQGLNADPFQSEDPFKSNPFSKGGLFISVFSLKVIIVMYLDCSSPILANQFI